jgi:hypothetical protein
MQENTFVHADAVLGGHEGAPPNATGQWKIERKNWLGVYPTSDRESLGASQNGVSKAYK